MVERRPRVIVSVEPEMKERIRKEADARFYGREPMVLLAGISLYLEMRELFGVRYEAAMEEIRARGHEKEIAA